MSRIGFDKRIHPYQMQVRICSAPDFQGIKNRSGVTLDFREGKIINYNTDEYLLRTKISEYIASDDELKELYDFFTLAAIEKFEATPENKLSQYMKGYYDWADLRYLMISGDSRVSDGVRHYIYSNDPIIMAVEWMRKTAPFRLDI